MVLLLALGSVPALGAGSEPVCATDGCPVLKSDPTDKCLPAYDDYALFIAGISNRESALAAYEDNPAWVRHAKFIDHNWESFTRGRLAPMREWAAKELERRRSRHGVLSLQRPGFRQRFCPLPPCQNLPADRPGTGGRRCRILPPSKDRIFLPACNVPFTTCSNWTFSKRTRCRASLGKGELKGTLPVLMFFLAREQARVLDVQYWVMQPDGSHRRVRRRRVREIAPPAFRGCGSSLTSPGSAGKSDALLLSVQSAQRFLGTQPAAFVSFLKSFGPVTTFTKAASYLMYKPHFSAIRQFILDQSLYVLQGDSGIPLRYFDPAVWNLRFYGTYTGPIALFSNCYQADMAAIYRQGQDIQPLPFGIDYRHRARTSNLMFASKKAKGLAGDPN